MDQRQPIAPSTAFGRVHRFEIHHADGAADPRATRLITDARGVGVELTNASVSRIYLVEADLDESQVNQVAALLSDSVTEAATIGASPAPPTASVVEVHPLPGVMDPASASVREAVRTVTGIEAEVATGWRYELGGVGTEDARRLAMRLLANPVVHAVHTDAFAPRALPTGTPSAFKLTHVSIRDLDDAALEKLSRDAHLFLSLDEMRAIRDEYKHLDREPTDIELETLAQTWSEHCVHKTLKSTVRYRNTSAPAHPAPGLDDDSACRPGHERDGDTIVIHNLLKSTVAAATFELIEEGIDWTLSVFVDNAGIVRLDEEHAVCVKVETHNHPSAIEPYGGAATGIGGCIRDIIGTGLAAKPIASTDVFCVAHPDDAVPSGCLPPARVLDQVVAGVRDYGNRMGIPTVNGAVWFDQRYVGNPLVFAGSIGLMPADLTHGDAAAGDKIVALGGRTGRDGIHGATFSSAELTDTHADEFSHAVQIGNPIEEKRVLDAIMRARDAEGGPLFSAITDCGAGGFSSAVGEMGEKVGATVDLEQAPLKYAGLTYTEIWISEAQERMVLSVPEARLAELQAICDEEGVELAVLGTFGLEGPDGPELLLRFEGNEVGRMPMAFLHDGIPMPTRDAVWIPAEPPAPSGDSKPETVEALLALLAEPNIASKHWIVRQYDHEVQGRTVIPPLVGPGGHGPGDGAVIEPVPGTGIGLAIGCGLATGIGDPEAGGDPYQMALAAIDECVRNLVCVGADPERIAILDNFCWPSCGLERNLAGLVRAAEGCYDGAKAYRTPFVSGKDSLNNQFKTEDGRTIEIPPTLLITGIGRVPMLSRVITMDAKRPGNTLVLVGSETEAMGGSHFARRFGLPMDHDPAIPVTNAAGGAATARRVAEAISSGLVRSAHDVSDGGLLCAVAEMLIAGSSKSEPIGASILSRGIPALFGEGASRYVLEVEPGKLAEVLDRTGGRAIGELNASGTLDAGASVSVDRLTAAWRGTLDW
ncbi:MAG: AIR synthase-related protein [Planctomycetota bacterium]